MPPRPHEEVLSRYVTVASFSLSVFRHINRQRGLPPSRDSHAYLTVQGTLNEPVGNVSQIEVQIGVDDTPASPASNADAVLAVGAVIQVKPVVSAVVDLPAADFERLWAMAVAGHVKYGYLAFLKPHHGRARIVSVSFSNEADG